MKKATILGQVRDIEGGRWDVCDLSDSKYGFEWSKEYRFIALPYAKTFCFRTPPNVPSGPTESRISCFSPGGRITTLATICLFSRDDATRPVDAGYWSSDGPQRCLRAVLGNADRLRSCSLYWRGPGKAPDNRTVLPDG
jgi:hypothetical protein